MRRAGLCYTKAMQGVDGAPAPGRTDTSARRATVGVGALVILLAVCAAGTGVLHGFDDGVADFGDLALRALIGALLGAAIGLLLVVGLRRLGPARTGVLGLASGAAVALVVLIVASVGATAGVATAPLHPDVPVVRSVDVRDTPRNVIPNDTLPKQDAPPGELPSWVGTVLAIIGLVLLFLLVLGFSRTFQHPPAEPARRLELGQPQRRRRPPRGARCRRRGRLVRRQRRLDRATRWIREPRSSPRTSACSTASPKPGARGWPTRHPRSTCAAASSRSACRPMHMEVVVGKFLVARFSTHPLTESDRDEVRDALRTSATQLREVAAARQAETAAATP